jgi:hypothetical protein
LRIVGLENKIEYFQDQIKADKKDSKDSASESIFHTLKLIKKYESKPTMTKTKMVSKTQDSPMDWHREGKIRIFPIYF